MMESIDPVIVLANWYRFAPGERIVHDRVMSVCFIWVVQGGGEIRTNERTFRMDAGVILRLPWGHRVDYRPDARDPFHLGTLHVVPHHSRSTPVEPRVPVLPDDPLMHDPGRSDGERRLPPALTSATAGAGRRIAELGTFAIERFNEAAFHEPVFRSLAEVVWLENDAWETWPTDPRRHPWALERMTTFVRENVRRTLTVAEVAAAGSCSASTAERMFRRHTDTSMGSWITQHRMREAALLLRTTNLRIGEVATRVGYADGLYFSRVFRRTFGVPPRQYAAGEMRP